MTTAVSASSEEQTAEQPVTAKTHDRWEALAVALLIIVLLMGAYFRFVGLNWDDNHHLHPDERFLTDRWATSLSPVEDPLDYLRTSVSTLNPITSASFYVYGNLPMTVTRYVAEWTNRLCETFGSAELRRRDGFCATNYTAYDGIHLVGRISVRAGRSCSRSF